MVDEPKCEEGAVHVYALEAIIRRVLSTFNDRKIRWSRSPGINRRKPTGTGSSNRARSSQSTDTDAIFSNTSIFVPSPGRFFLFRFFRDLRRNTKNIEECYFVARVIIFLVNKRSVVFYLTKRTRVARIKYLRYL